MPGSGHVPLDSSKDRRRDHRRGLVAGVFADAVIEAALDVLALMDLAWHDCYGESSPPDSVVDDVITVSAGDPAGMVRAALLGVTDFRDLRLAADEMRRR